MKIFLDTANIESVRRCAEVTHVIDGITTNPSHLSKESGQPLEIVRELCEIMGEHGSVCVQVTQSDAQAAYKEAHRIAKISDTIVVKIPCVPAMYHVIEQLVIDGITVNVTLVFSVAQALFMAKMGVAMVSPFVGRLDDAHFDGIGVLKAIVQAFVLYGFETEVLAASIRSVERFEQALAVGAHIVTLPETVFEKAMRHPLSDKGLEQFITDWQRFGKPLL